MTRTHWRTATIRAALILGLTLAAVVASGKDRSTPQRLERLRRVAFEKGIEIVTDARSFPVADRSGRIDGKAAKRGELEAYAELLAQELSIYPADLFRRTKVTHIVLGRDLSIAGRRQGAIPGFTHGTLYLDVRRGNYDATHQRKVIHHELFHMIDYQDDGSWWKDEGWASLNPSRFRYGRGGRSAQRHAETSVLTDRYPGFLNHYSTTAVEEDKAEMYANLIVDARYVKARASGNRVIAAKAKYMKELLVRFCPSMNQDFWRRAKGVVRAKPTSLRTASR